jgi:hypothetical protein
MNLSFLDSSTAFSNLFCHGLEQLADERLMQPSQEFSIAFHPPFASRSHNVMIIKQAERFPKPLVPVQVRAGAPLRERELRNGASVFGIFEWASFGSAGTLPGLSEAPKS